MIKTDNRTEWQKQAVNYKWQAKSYGAPMLRSVATAWRAADKRERLIAQQMYALRMGLTWDPVTKLHVQKEWNTVADIPRIQALEAKPIDLERIKTMANKIAPVKTTTTNSNGEVVNSRVTVNNTVAPKKPETPKRTPVVISRINASEIFRVGICGDPGKRRVEITLRNGNRFMHKHTYAVNASLKITDNDCVDSAMRMATLVRKAPSVTIEHWSLLPQSK